MKKEMENKQMNENEVVIEEQKIIRMVNRIYELERENNKNR